MIRKILTSAAGETEHYSKDFFCERTVLLRKLDAVLEYLQHTQFINPNHDFSYKDIPKSNKKVFVVHGHNEAAKESVARFIEKLGLEAVILHEHPNKGRTIIEKFIACYDVDFAVVILSADDVGAKETQSDEKLQPRARQNVIFELGYFIGTLGRERVFALYEEGVEIPSDYTGVIFELLDSKGNWKFAISKELKEVGFEIDLNEIL